MNHFGFTYHKMWHCYINAIFVKLIGHKDYSVAAPELIFGTASLAVVYFFAAMIAGPAVGLIAAGILALSGLHILHSRSAEPEIGTGLSFLLCLLFSAAQKSAFHGGPTSFSDLFAPFSILLLAASGFFSRRHAFASM